MRNGEVVLLDTGSTDNTVKLAKEWGCIVEEGGNKFDKIIHKELADAINDKFCVLEDKKIVNEGDKIFDFSRARNYCASLASNDFVFMPDCDEVLGKMNIDAVEKYITDGYDKLEFNFVFGYGQNGQEMTKYIHCKFYNKKKTGWVNVIHEVLSEDVRKMVLPESVLKLLHHQNKETSRKSYLVGLAVDCFDNPNNDRNSHYFARELMYRGFTEEAIKEFTRHITIGKWDAERSKSMIYIGDCLIKLGQDEGALSFYHKAFLEYSGRREPLIKLGKYFFDKKDWQKAIIYLEGCLPIKFTGLYLDDASQYGDYVYGLLYTAYWYLGNKEKSKEYFDMALLLSPHRKEYLDDAVFCYGKFEYQDQGIDGWMTAVELDFLFRSAKEMNSILEIGSWKGRSTHALLSGCPGMVQAVDHFKGSDDDNDLTKFIAKNEDIYQQFFSNVGSFKNLIISRMSSDEAEKALPAGKSFDMVFIDGEHTYDGVKKDIKLWKRHAEIMLCGHDYTPLWPGVVKAVDEELGKPDKVVGSIWVKLIKR